ncbi:MAG: hypothetical protein IMF04_00950, partial [Proteobacteria bacterium]|nr:hypothetical protein [Pseudomonadota bacterium]
MNLRLKRALITLSMAASLAACSDDAPQNDTALQSTAPPMAVEPQSKLPVIDSSNWTVDPTKHGMTAMEYTHAESHAFMNEFAINRNVGLSNFFHFTTLAKANDKWVVSPSLDHLYSIFIIDTSKP